MELGHLKVFGCIAYAHVEATKRSKLDSKSQKMTFIGYPQGVKGYLLWNLEAQNAIISRDVIFDEKSILKRSGISETRKMKVNSGGQSEIDDMQSTSTYRSIPVEVELGRKVLSQIENSHGGPTIQTDVQEQP